MLHELISANRRDLIQRCQAKVGQRCDPQAMTAELAEGIPLFLDQLVKTLRFEQLDDLLQSHEVSGPPGGGKPLMTEMGQAAASYGRALLRQGLSVDQVVHNYGDVCQAITDLGVERDSTITVDEFRTLNRCLDNAIADAVTEFSYQKTSSQEGRQGQELDKRLGFFAHELRNLLNSATLALTAIKTGNVGLNGATASVLDRSLVGLRNLIDRTVSEVRMNAGLPIQHRVQSLADFIAEVKLPATLEAQTRNCEFSAAPVDPQLAVDVDRDLLHSAVGNLLQNAFKFSHPHSEVTLSAYAAADRILIEVADHCGGLPPGAAKEMFLPFVQAGADRSGLGLGLTIARRSVEANQGTLGVRDIPGTGCVFTISLPRHAMPPLAPTN